VFRFVFVCSVFVWNFNHIAAATAATAALWYMAAAAAAAALGVFSKSFHYSTCLSSI
jgi:hypothetical protein